MVIVHASCSREESQGNSGVSKIKKIMQNRCMPDFHQTLKLGEMVWDQETSTLPHIFPLIRSSTPAMAMAFIQLNNAVAIILSKMATDSGMSQFVMVTYRHAVATLVIAPLAFFMERKKCPRLTFPIICHIFLAGLIGLMASQNLYVAGTTYTSPAFACSFINLNPAVTHLINIIFRKEKVKLRSGKEREKLLGISACIGGAAFMIFFRGILLKPCARHVAILNSKLQEHSSNGNWLLGSAFLFGFCISCSSLSMLQRKINKEYPAPYCSCFLMFMSATLQSAIVAYVVERSNLSAWVLSWELNLFTVTYSVQPHYLSVKTVQLSQPFQLVDLAHQGEEYNCFIACNQGLVTILFGFCLMRWCTSKRGYSFAPLFSPLLLTFVAIFSCMLLDEKMHIGSLIGSILIVVGLYAILWGETDSV
ncbi:WAT1-related protein At1g09380-like [Nymphaea colorata]|nr:WAT1-related protein At1g09380-like [Nymphaea colorata]